MSPPDGLLTPDDAKHAKHDVDLDPDPFYLDKCLNDSSPACLDQLTTTVELNMSTSEDGPSPGLNERLRPRKSSYVSSPQNKAKLKNDRKPAQDRPKRTSTPSKPSPNKQDDLATKSDFSPTPHFLCPYCDKKFASRQTMSKHVRRSHLPNAEKDTLLNCLFCNHTETDISIMRHMVDSHPNQYFACLDCHTRFSSTSELAEHKLHICEKQKISFRTTLRQKPRGAKKSKKSLNVIRKEDNKDFQDRHGFNGIVISCELKPPKDHDGADIEDNITTNLILPSTKNLANKAMLEKNAVIVLDDIQWNKRIPSNFSFHNTDPDQILSRLGVVHRSPRTGESTKKDWFKLMDDSNQKFERCFDTKFYSKVASNVQENLSKFLDGSCNFNPDPENTIKTRKSKNNVVINTAEGFPILLACEQYSRSAFDSYLPRAIAPKHKWKWDNLENDKTPLNPDQIKRDSHTNNCIITLVSGLDIWTQLSMRKKFESIYNHLPVEKKTEKQNIISKELKEILESREIPTSSQVVKYTNRPIPSTSRTEFPAALGLVPATPTYELQPAVLSGEWVRPRCYVCCACGEQTTDPKGLSTHIMARHPNAYVQHYEIVGELLLNADILKHLYVPPRTNRTRLPRGFKECTKCNKSVTLEELHQHMLDCAGDTPAVRRRQCRHRPFNVRRRRPRVPDNTIRKKMRKDIRSRKRHQKAHIRPRPRIRTEVGDAETIRKMLADLPAKRHRVLVNPVNMTQRPRRKLDVQRSKLMINKRTSDDIKNRNRHLSKGSSSDKKIGASSSNEPIKNSSVVYDDEDNKPLKPKDENKTLKSKHENRSLKPKLKKIINKRKHQHEALKKKSAVMTSKRKSNRVQNNKIIENTDKLGKATVASTSIEIQEASIDKPTERLDLKKASYNPRDHANRGSSGNRDGQHPSSSGTNGAGNNARVPAQNVPLKHSIARLTANSETHDKSVQFHHSFLVQQECNNTNQHLPTGQPTLFENEAVVTKLDKPPLNYSHKSFIDAQASNKNRLNKPRKGLNDCIAMLKNKLVEPEPFQHPGHVSVQCGSDEPIDSDPRIIMHENLRDISTNSECYPEIIPDKSCEQRKKEYLEKIKETSQKIALEKLASTNSSPEKYDTCKTLKSPEEINKKALLNVKTVDQEVNNEMNTTSCKSVITDLNIENALNSKPVSDSNIDATQITAQPVDPKRNVTKTTKPKCLDKNAIPNVNRPIPKSTDINKHFRVTRATNKQKETNLISKVTKNVAKVIDNSLNKNVTVNPSRIIEACALKVHEKSSNTGIIAHFDASKLHGTSFNVGANISPRPIDIFGVGANISPRSTENSKILGTNISPRSYEMGLNVTTHMSNNVAAVSPGSLIFNKSPGPIDMNINSKFDAPRNIGANLNEIASPLICSRFERNPLSVDVSADLRNLQSMEFYKENAPMKTIQASLPSESNLSWRNPSDVYSAKVDIPKRSKHTPQMIAINLNESDVRVGGELNSEEFTENRIIDVTPNIFPAHSNTIVEPLTMVGPLDLSSKFSTSKDSSIVLNTTYVPNYDNYETLDLSNKSSSSRLPDSFIPGDVIDLRVKPSEHNFIRETLDLCVKSSNNKNFDSSDIIMVEQEDLNYPTDLSLRGKETAQLRAQNPIDVAQNVSSCKTIHIENEFRNTDMPPAELAAKIVPAIKPRVCEEVKDPEPFIDQTDSLQSKSSVYSDERPRKSFIKNSSENAKSSSSGDQLNKIEQKKVSEKYTSKLQKPRFSDKYNTQILKPVYDPSIKIPLFKLRPESGDITELITTPVPQLPEDQNFSKVSVGFQNSPQIFGNVSRGALTGGVALQTLPNPAMVHNQIECSTPIYSLTNVAIPVSKKETSKSPALTTTLLNLPVSTIINTEPVYTHTRTSSGNTSKFGASDNEFPNLLCPSSQNNTKTSKTCGFRNETPGDAINKSNEASKIIAGDDDHDPDTARKIAMLPKELVEILGNMPVDHRNQLLNVLPQYVSPSVTGVTPLTSKTRQNDRSQTGMKINMSNIEEKQKNDKTMTDDFSENTPLSPLLRENSPKDSIAQTVETSRYDLQMSVDKDPSVNNDLNVTSVKHSCKDKSSVASVDTDKISTEVSNETPPIIMTDKGVIPDFGKSQEKVIDLTEDELVPSIPKVPDLPRSSQLLPQEPLNPLVGNLIPNKQKSNEKTASLRAVRIKAPSERQKESQMLKRASVEQVVPQIIPESDDVETSKTLELSKTLAIQQAEISSTQHNKINKTNFTVIKNTLPVDNTEVIKPKSPKNSDPVINTKTEVEKLTKSIIATPNIEPEKTALVTPANESHDVFSKEETAANPDINTINDSCPDEKSSKNTSELTPEIVNKSLTDEIELSLDDTSKTDTEKLNQNAPAPNVETNISEQDDSEDDMILAAIVKQKQTDINLLNEIDLNPKLNEPPVDKKRKKGKKTKKISTDAKKIEDNESIPTEEPATMTDNDGVKLVNQDSSVDQDSSPKKKSRKLKENQKSRKLQKCEKELENEESNEKIESANNVISLKVDVKNVQLDDENVIDSETDGGGVGLVLTHITQDKNIVISTDMSTCLGPNKTSTPLTTKESKSSTQKGKQKKKKKAEPIDTNPAISSVEIMANNILPLDSNSKNSNSLCSSKDSQNADGNADNKTEYIEITNKKPEHEPENDPESQVLNTKREKDTISCNSAQESLLNNDLDDIYTNLPLRRSRRGKSLFVETSTLVENETITDNAIDHKAPLTKKQLIFSKLLLDEEIQNKTVNTNQDNTKSDCSKTAIENKSVKRKQSPQLKKKCKKKKSVDSIENLSDIPLNSEVKKVKCDTKEKTDLKQSSEVLIDSVSSAKVENFKEDSHSSVEISKDNKEHEKLCNLESETNKKNLDDSKTSIEKRKISLAQSSSIENELNSKPKKLKINKKEDNDWAEALDETIKETSIDNKSDDIELRTSTKIQPITCYDVPLAARRTRSKSVVVKSLSNEVYDPYDIDLDEMIQKAEPIKKPTIKHTKVKGKTKLFSSKQLGKVGISNFCKTLNSEDTSKQKLRRSKPETSLKHTKHDKDASVIKTNDPNTIKNNKEVNKKIPKDNSSDSDDSSKSINIPLKKYVESKTKKISENNDANVKDSNRDSGRHNQGRSLSVDCSKNDKAVELTDESAEQMRSEQFMESFGFFSERKPRKSNLLATKKISETFHIIASESDDSYIESGGKNSRRSIQSDSKKSADGDKKYLKRGRKKKNSMLENVTYCEVCTKKFHRPDNYIRHIVSMLHVARVANVQLGMNTLPIREKPNYYTCMKLHLNHAREKREKIKSKEKKGKKVFVPTMVDMIKDTFKTVRAQRLLLYARKDLSSDEALFIDCCELLKESHKPVAATTNVTEVQPTTSDLSTTNNITDKTDPKIDDDSLSAILEGEEYALGKELLTADLLKNPECTETPCMTWTGRPRIIGSKLCLESEYNQLSQNKVSEDEESSSELETESQKNIKLPEIKEKMYPDIEEIDMFEDKFDKIKRKCRSQAAAAKQAQSVTEPLSGNKGRKKADKKKGKKSCKKKYQSTILTKGALKGFDGIRVSIPTSDINMSAIVSSHDVGHKKKRKINSKKKREKNDSENTNKYENNHRNKDNTVSQKKVDVYEFMDNEDAEFFEFRPSTLMERFKSISNKETPNTSKRDLKVDEPDISSESGSDGDDFVYMSDDYVCSDDETENSLMSCELGIVKTDMKKLTSLKRKDVVEKNAVMGKIFKNNAVRSEKKIMKKEIAKPKANLDQLFDSLLVEEPNSTSINTEPQSPKSAKKVTLTADSSLPNYEEPKSFDQRSPDHIAMKKKTDSLSPERSHKMSSKQHDAENDLSPTQYETPKRHIFGPTTSTSIDIYGPSTSKKFDTLILRESSVSPPKKHDSSLRKIIDVVSPRTNVELDLIKFPLRKLHESEFSVELDDDTGVARQRARRKCTVGKQNVLAETWSSESEPDGVPPRPNSAESVVASAGRKKKGRKREGQHSIGRRGKVAFSKKHDVESRVNSSNRNTSSNSGGPESGSGVGASSACEAAASASPVAGPSGVPPKVRPRPAAYYWSSEGDDEQEHQQQHGWIVGDSHKKLVTMLAHAKGRKHNNEDKRHFFE